MRISDWSSDVCSSDLEMAEGYLAIAVENMANAIKKISVARGYDVTKYVLSSFGGAGGQHACLVADALGMTEVLLHPLAGVLSAYGMGLADQRVLKEKSVEVTLEAAALPALAAEIDTIATEAKAEMLAQGVPRSEERRGGKECGTTCRSRWSPHH